MASKNQTTKLTIVINGNEIKNTISDVGAEVGRLNRELKNITFGTKEYTQKLAELNKARSVFNRMQADIKGTNKSMDQLFSSLGGFGPVVGAAFSIYSAVEFGKAIIDNIKRVRELKSEVQETVRINGRLLDTVTAKIDALSQVWNKDFSEILNSANVMNKVLGISFPESLSLIQNGFENGTNASGKMLSNIQKYAPHFKEAKISAQDMMDIIKVGALTGDDNAIQTIQEGLNRIRTGAKKTQEAMSALGIDTKKIYDDLQKGTLSYYDVIKLVSEKLDKVGGQSKVTGQAITAIFGGAGKNAGYEYLASLYKLEDQINDLGNSTNELTELKKKDLEATEKLSRSWLALTGAGSALDRVWISMKSGISDLMVYITGAEKNSEELTRSYVEQAKKVKELEEKIPPLLSEYDKLKSKTNLNETEQQRLKTVIQQLANQVPSAITVFDQYGRALDINSDKVRDFIQQQKTMLAYMNKDAIKKAEEDADKYFKKWHYEQNKLNLQDDKGILKYKRNTNALFGPKEQTYYNSDEIKQIQTRVDEYKKMMDGAKALAKELKGGNLELLEKKKETPDKPNSDAPSAEELKAQQTAAKKAALEAKKLQNEQQRDKKKLQDEALKEEEKFQKSLQEAERKYQDETLSQLADSLEKEQTLLALGYARKQEDLQNEISALEKLQKEYTSKAAEASKLGDTTTAGKFKKLADEQVKIIRAKEDTIDSLEKSHAAKRLQLVYKYKQKEFEQQEAANQKELNALTIKHNEEITRAKDLNSTKEELQRYLNDEELTKIKTYEQAKQALTIAQQKNTYEAQAILLKEYQDKLDQIIKDEEKSRENGFGGVYTDEQLKALKDNLEKAKLSLSDFYKSISEIETAKEKAAAEKEKSARNQMLSGIDLLGFSAEDWNTTFENMEKAEGPMEKLANKIKLVSMAVQTLQNAWSMMYEAQAEASRRSIQQYENETNRKKEALKKQLDEKYISQATYDAKVEKLEAEMEKRKADMEYKAAKEKYKMDIASVLSSTALGIMNAVATAPNIIAGLALSAVVAAMGALQLGVITSNKPKRASYHSGGDTIGLGFKDETGHEVAGVVHANEYVMPEWLLKDPEIAQLKNYVEYKRKGGSKSFAEGGEATSSAPTSTGQPAGMDPQILSLLINILQENAEVLTALKQQGVIAFLSNDVKTLTHLSKQQEDAKKIMSNNRM